MGKKVKKLPAQQTFRHYKTVEKCLERKQTCYNWRRDSGTPTRKPAIKKEPYKSNTFSRKQHKCYAF